MNASTRLAGMLSLMSVIGANAFAQNLYPNPDFNDSEGAEGWSAEPGFVHMQLLDASGCPRSGSLVATAEVVGQVVYDLSAHGPCLAFAAPATVSARMVYRGGGVCPTCDGAVFFQVFSNDACTGTAITSVGHDFGLVADWTALEATFQVPAGGSVEVMATGGGDDIAIIEIDEIRVTAPEYLYFDDFDGGGVCRWSASGG